MSHEPLNLPENREHRIAKAVSMDDSQIAAGSALPPECPHSLNGRHEWTWRDRSNVLLATPQCSWCGRAVSQSASGDAATGWFRIVADIKVCPKCWAPVQIISDQEAGTGTYDYDGRAEHICTKQLTLWGRFQEFMRWHKPGKSQIWNPASASGYEARCVRCGERLLQDSQGNWFTIDATGLRSRRR